MINITIKLLNKIYLFSQTEKSDGQQSEGILLRRQTETFLFQRRIKKRQGISRPWKDCKPKVTK